MKTIALEIDTENLDPEYRADLIDQFKQALDAILPLGIATTGSGGRVRYIPKYSAKDIPVDPKMRFGASDRVIHDTDWLPQL